MKYSISDLALTVVMTVGNSGAGKGDAITEIGRKSNDNNIHVRGTASGIEFRKLFAIYQNATASGKLSDLDPDVIEAVALMRSGQQVEGIYPIADGVIEKIKEHLVALQNEEKSLLILDGIPRNSEDTSAITPGKRLPSQILQLAEMFRRAIKELVNEGKIELTDEDADLLEYTRGQDLKTIKEDNLGLTKIAGALRKDANYVVVHVSDETAGVLMRNRSFKELAGIYKNLATRDDQDNDKVEKALGAIDKLMLIQSNSFKVEDNQIITDELINNSRLFDPFDEKQIETIDRTVQEICRQGLVDLVGEKVLAGLSDDKIIEMFIKSVKTEFGIKSDLRSDDMTTKVRDIRINEYNTKVVGNVFRELGIKVESSDGSSPELRKEGPAQHVFLIHNEIDRVDPEKGYKHYLGEVGNMGDNLFMELGYLPVIKHDRAIG